MKRHILQMMRKAKPAMIACRNRLGSMVIHGSYARCSEDWRVMSKECAYNLDFARTWFISMLKRNRTMTRESISIHLANRLRISNRQPSHADLNQRFTYFHAVPAEMIFITIKFPAIIQIL